MSDTTPDTSAPSIGEQFRSFPKTFWWANWMEVVERFSYYGLRTVVPIYMVLSFEEGGPQFSHEQKGQIFAIWALVQSFVPIFSGGFADRFGYKISIAISTVIKIAGYLVMGYAIEMASSLNGQSMAELGGAAGGAYTYPLFFAGAMLLATGTAIFKPGVQGLIGNTMPAKAGSFGWGIFYQMVNIGGFIGPMLAAILQLLSWKMVFLMCAGGIALNFIPLFLFAEPVRKEGEGYTGMSVGHVLADTVKEFLRPRVLFFTLSFAGFWLMFYQLFDILPNFIDDWVDSGEIVTFLHSFLPHGMVAALPNGNLNQAMMINLDAFMIMFFAFAFGFVTGKFKSLPTMVLGIFLSAITIYMLGMSMNGWWTLFAIGLFAIGEMIASPTKLRYMNDIAPKGKEGLFLGFANATVGIGWFVGSHLAGSLYEHGGDKVNLALQELAATRDRPALVRLLSEEELVDAAIKLDDSTEIEVLAELYAPDDPNAVTAARERARAILASDPKEVEKLKLIQDDKVFPRRLATRLGIPSFDASLLLLLPGMEQGFDLPSLEAKVLPLWQEVADARGLSSRKREASEPLAGLFAEATDQDLAAATRWLAQAVQLPANAADFEAQLALEQHVPAAGLIDLRQRLLDQAAEKIEAGEVEEGDAYVRKAFQRSRVFSMVAAEEGMSEQDFKQYLWDKYEPYSMWRIFALIGCGSGVLLMIYDYGVRRYDAKLS